MFPEEKASYKLTSKDLTDCYFMTERQAFYIILVK